MLKITGAMLVAGLTLAAPAMAADAPAEIKIGTLYASSGRFASISMPVFSGLKLWTDLKNADGGVYVKAFDKKLPVKLVGYDDQSNTATASTLYNQLITQDKVDLLVADSGSVLTAPAVAIARDRKMFLFDQTGTGASFFSKDNPYIALMADPVSTVWPKPARSFARQSSSAPCTPGSTSSTPSRPCTTTALVWQNALSWASTPSATCVSTRRTTLRSAASTRAS